MRLRSRQSSTASVGTSEAIYRRALAVFEECFGPVHYEVAATLHNLAAVLVTKRSEEHTSELQSRLHLVCRLLLEKKKKRALDNTCITIKPSMLSFIVHSNVRQ